MLPSNYNSPTLGRLHPLCPLKCQIDRIKTTYKTIPSSIKKLITIIYNKLKWSVTKFKIGSQNTRKSMVNHLIWSTDTSTLIITWENDIIECNYVFRSPIVTGVDTPSIRSVSATKITTKIICNKNC